MSKACNNYVLLSLLMVNLTNQQQVEPWAIGKWFHGKVWKILMTFLWSIRVQTMENCCWFVCLFFFFFAITLISWHLFPLKFLRKSRAQEREQQTAPPSYHFHAQHLSTIWLLTNQCVKNHSVMAKTHVEGQNEIQDKMVSTCVVSQFPFYLRPNIILYDHKQLRLENKWKWESSNIKTILTRISFSLDFIIWGDVERWLTKTICQCN